MAMTLYEPAFAAIERWSDDPVAKNNALATVTLLGGLASPILAPIWGLGITHLGWRWAIAGSAIPLLAMIGIYHQVLGSAVPSAPQVAAAPLSLSPLLWWIGTAAFVSSFGAVVVLSYLPTYLTHRGYSLAVPTAVIATMGLAQVPARFFITKVLR